MSQPPDIPLRLPAPTPAWTLRRLFLTLFLRGRSARGLKKEGAPKSVGTKLALTIVLYALFGLLAFGFRGQDVFTFSIYLHAMTLVFLGMFVAASAGEILFNKEESDILLHRPVTARALLWAKIGVLARVSFWLAGAFNLAGFFIGANVRDGNWLFPVAHLISTVFLALFCTASVVLAYQVCLRWFGRERLEGMMTTAQVIVSMAAVFGGQIVPRLMMRPGGNFSVTADTWWMVLLPPAWFAGFNDVLAGGGSASSRWLAGCGMVVTALVLWLAFVKLAADYQSGLQTLGESSPRPRQRTRRRWMDALVGLPPLKWWLRSPVSRASFLLTAAYLARDRDTKLRVYPGIAPILVLPIIFLMPGAGKGGVQDYSFGLAFSGAYLGLIPLLALNLLRHSQQWQAADLFRIAPMAGPAELWHGARRAVLFFLTLPLLVAVSGLVLLMSRQSSQALLLLPGLMALPIYALLPCLRGKAAPFSVPVEEAKSAGRGLSMIWVMLVSMGVSGLGLWSWNDGWFGTLILTETLIVAGLYALMRRALANIHWQPIDS